MPPVARKDLLTLKVRFEKEEWLTNKKQSPGTAGLEVTRTYNTLKKQNKKKDGTVVLLARSYCTVRVLISSPVTCCTVKATLSCDTDIYVQENVKNEILIAALKKIISRVPS